MEIYVFAWIGSALLTAVVASSKNRNGCGWYALGMALGPIGLVASLAMPQARPKVPVAEEELDTQESEPTED